MKVLAASRALLWLALALPGLTIIYRWIIALACGVATAQPEAAAC
jgi:hypothetical protein